MPSDTFYSHPEALQYATPSQLERQQGYGLIDTLRRDPPGQWAENKYLQSSKFTGPVYLAIKTTMTAMGSIIPQLQRRQKHSNKTTFLGQGATLKKALNPNAFGQDQEYVPAESDHPVQQLLDHPNDRGDTFKDVLRYLILQHRLTGVAPLWCIPNARHQPVELFPLPTALTLPQFARSEQYPNGYYRLMPYYASGTMGFLPSSSSGAGAIIPAEEIQRRKDPHPFLMWDGYSPLTAGGVELDILEAIDQCWWAVLDHGVILDTLLMMPGADQSMVSKVEQGLKVRHGGARNTRRMFVMGGGDSNAVAKYDVKQLSPNVRDMDFPNGRATMLEFCLALFDVPMEIANLSVETGSYSKLYATVQKWRLLALQPDAQSWADCFSKWLCDPWSKRPGDYRIKMDLPALSDPDLNEKQIATDINIRTVNERRAGRDLPPAEKFGDYPEPVYLALLQNEAMPEPIMPPSADSMPGNGGAPRLPQPNNPAGRGSRGPIAKARRLRPEKARAALAKMVRAVVGQE